MICCFSPSQRSLKNWECSTVVKHLPNMPGALGSISPLHQRRNLSAIFFQETKEKATSMTQVFGSFSWKIFNKIATIHHLKPLNHLSSNVLFILPQWLPLEILQNKDKTNFIWVPIFHWVQTLRIRWHKMRNYHDVNSNELKFLK